MRKIMPIFIILFFIFTSFAPRLTIYAAEPENKEGPELAADAKSAIIIEQDTGAVLYEKDTHERLPPASMTKIMTLLLIMEALEQGEIKLDEMIRVSENAASMGGSQIFLEPGEEMAVADLLKGIAVASANDASVALAERIAGSEETFVKQMNNKVEELGLENTKFQNTSGLPAKDHYSSAYDMSIIARELLKYESITDYTSIYEDYLRKGQDNEFWLVNTNKLVRFYQGVDGLKTGYTSEAKYCLAATAKKDNMRVIAVVLGYDTSKARNAAVSSMLDYAFNQFETKKLFTKGEKITELNTLKGERKKTNIITSQAVSTVYPKGQEVENITSEYKIDEDITLPIKQGDHVGELLVKSDEEILAKIPLTVEEPIDKARFFTLFKRSLQEMTAFE